MANNVLQIKRTSVSGRAANTTTLTNPGELGLNMTDGIMYSTNGSVVFEVGANLTSIAVGNSTNKFTSNSTGAYHTGVVNAASHTVGASFTANSTLVNAAAINIVGQVNTATLYAATSANIASAVQANSTGVFTTGTANAATLSVGTAFIANTTGTYHTGTINAASFTVGATVVANSTAVYATRLNSKTEANLNVNAATFSNTILVPDTRAVATTPETTSSPQVRFDFKQNTTDGLSDGGTYFGEMSFRPYGSTTDWSGGPAHQLGFTANNNLYHRSGNSTTWGSWGRLYKEGTLLTPGANVVLGSFGVSANGSYGTAGQVLHSNGTATYWAADDQGVTSVAAANGLNGGTITSTGTLSVLGGSTLTVNTTGVHVNQALSITDLTLSGNLTVSGTTTYVNSTTLNIGDNIITLNADVGGAVAPTENAGIEVNRGSSANVQFLWDETNDRWSTNGQPLALSSLVATGAASGITTLAAGNTTITGFVNATSTVNASGLAVGTSFVANSTQTTFAQPVRLNNEQQLRFQTVNSTAYAYFVQQSDDNFVLYTSNTTYGARPVFAVFANTANSAFDVVVPLKPSAGIVANGSFGSSGQVLKTNGTNIYWDTSGGTGTVTSVATANGLSGGPITTSGTIGITSGSTLTVNTTGIHVNTANLSIATSQLTGDVALGTNTSGNYVATVSNANGISGSSATEGGTPTIGVVTGSTLTVNTTGIHVNSNLSITSLQLAGAASGITTLAAGNTTITGFANVSTTLQVGGTTTLAANLVMANNNITRPVLTGYTEAEVSNTSVTGSWTMDCGVANFFDLTLTGNTTISPTNVPPSTRVWSGTIAAKQDATGGRTITWPTGIKWPGGSAPPATTTANAIDIWSLMTYDGGTTWVGSLTVKNVA